MRFIVKKIVLLAVCALFFACLDSTESVDVPKEGTGYLRAFGSAENLPECTSEIEGMFVFVSDLRMVQVCADGAWRTIGSNETDVSVKKSNCTTKLLKDSSGVKVICDGDSVGVIKNGAKGDKGEKGETGETGDSGKKGPVGDKGTVGEKGDPGADGENGKPGEKGDSGGYCRTWNLPDDSGYKIVCDGDSVGVIYHGFDGEDVDECTVSRSWMGYEKYRYSIYCGDELMGSVVYGEDAVGCIADTLDSLVKIRCGEDTTSFIVDELGACSEWRNGVIAQKDELYYICIDGSWELAIDREYDTYGYNCYEEGRVVRGKVTDKYYYCENGEWRYASKMESDTYGIPCTKDGAIARGVVEKANKYVCDGGTLRAAVNDADNVNNILARKFTEADVNLGCTSYTADTTIEFHYGNFWYAILKCYEYHYGYWAVLEYRPEPNPPYGTLIDSRDGKSYKTVVLGSQTWMAENLNYGDSIKYRSLLGGLSRCSAENPMDADTCAKYGRAYTWAAVMDSTHTGCGYGSSCSVEYPFQGVCPDGWHVPTYEEFWELVDYVGGPKKVERSLFAIQGWSENEYGYYNCWDDFGMASEMCWLPDGPENGIDAYGFAAYPTDGGESHVIYSSSENETSWQTPAAFALLGSVERSVYGAVRCVKNSD